MAQPLSVTLTPSDHNGYAVSCFGEKDGSITAQISGGTPPYQYGWSTGGASLTITNQPAGYYSFKVTDDAGTTVTAEIMLLEPNAIRVGLTPVVYPNDYNISCWECHNGMIYVDVSGGSAPFNYVWNDGLPGALRTGLGAKQQYSVEVTDANGCSAKTQKINLTQPERNDWGMTGNTGSDANVHYIGTADAQDVVFKSNGAEVLRLKSNGDISLLGSLTGSGPLYRMEDGTLRGGGFPDFPELPPELCHAMESYPYWETRGNAFSQLCPEGDPLLGTLGDLPLKMVTNGVERMRITEAGRVAIGATDAPETQFHVEGDLLVRGSTHGDIITRSNAQEGAAIWARNTGAAWGLSIDPDGKGHILGDWNNPTPHVSFTYDRVEMPTRLVIGDMEPMEGYRLSVAEGIRTDRIVVGDVEPREGYRLMVQEGILTERVKVALRTSTEWSDHVFLPGYRLMPLSEVECFIQENGHLPGVPSAAQMVEQGLDVVKTDAMLMEKIEEVTLYLITMEKRVMKLESENAALRQMTDGLPVNEQR